MESCQPLMRLPTALQDAFCCKMPFSSILHFQALVCALLHHPELGAESLLLSASSAG